MKIKLQLSILATLLSLLFFPTNANAQTTNNLLSNISFENGFTGWVNNGMFTQTNNVFPNKDGNTYIERWVSRGQSIPNVSVQQTITGVTNGYYSLTVAAGNIQQSASGSTINNSSTPQTGVSIFANNVETSVNTVKDYTIDFFVNNGTITLGLKAENATGNWLTCDNFRLVYNGENSKTYIQELVDAANTLLSDKMNNNVRTELVSAINLGDQTIADEAATEQTIADVIQHIKEKELNAQISVNSYENLQTTIDSALAIYDDGSGKEAIALQTAINTAKDTSNNFSISLEEVNNATEALNLAIDEYNFANKTDFTDYIENPSFESSLNGWENNGMASQGNNAFSKKEGNTYAEKYVSTTQNMPNASIQQTINGLPNGFYTLTVAAGNSNTNNLSSIQTGVYIFANDDKTPVNIINDYTINLFVSNGTTTIGLKAENASGNWIACDNFRLIFNGFDIESSKTFIQELVDTANGLLTDKMSDDYRTELISAINSGDQAIANQSVTKETLASTIQLLKDQTLNAQISVNSYLELQTAIDEALIIYGDGNGNEAAELDTAINNAITSSNNFTLSVNDIHNAINTLNTAVDKYGIANATGPAPTVITNPNYARGATMAFGRSTISGVNISTLKEHGFCWSTNPEPTIFDNKTTKYLSSNGNIYHLENLEPSTVYYMRAYAVSSGNAIGYGDVIKFITIPKGTVTYNLTSGLTGDNRTRVEAAMSSAINYYNNLTSIKGHHITVNYGSGTPTAEASYGGWMRFGPNASYQRTGTALHEMAHTIGVGTHSMWYGPSSPLRETGSRGLWLGERVDKVIQFISNNPNEHLTGDNVHMWPYGINGAQEDNGSELLYITNCLIAQALGEDGLPPTGNFATPAYTFELKDNIKYYIKSEEETTRRDNAFITIDESGNLINKVMTPSEAMGDDNAAWYLEFNPSNSYYTIKNAATGKYFTYKNTGSNGISTIARATPASNDYFQLMNARVETTIGSESYKGYWIIHPEASTSPAVLRATTSDLTTTQGLNLNNTSTSQRWLILDSNDVEELKSTLSLEDNINTSASNNLVYSEDNVLHVKNISANTEITVYDIRGVLILKENITASSFSHRMKTGIYVVILSSDANREVKKILIH